MVCPFLQKLLFFNWKSSLKFCCKHNLRMWGDFNNIMWGRIFILTKFWNWFSFSENFLYDSDNARIRLSWVTSELFTNTAKNYILIHITMMYSEIVSNKCFTGIFFHIQGMSISELWKKVPVLFFAIAVHIMKSLSVWNRGWLSCQ